jgi:AcrR family transcriptional regulator
VARTVGSNAPETRRRILDSAADAFAAHGYSGASMRDIAESLGITKAALYYHFASKEDLLDGLVHPVMQAMTDFADTAQTGELTTTEILSGFIHLTIDSVPALFPLMVDPGARSAIKTRYDLPGLNRRIETALAGDGGPEAQLRAQFALGGIRSIVVGRLIGGMHGDEKCAANGPREADLAGAGVPASGRRGENADGEKAEPPLSEAECSVLLEAALAGLVT